MTAPWPQRDDLDVLRALYGDVAELATERDAHVHRVDAHLLAGAASVRSA